METKNRSVLFNGLVVGIEQMDVLIGEQGWYTYQVVRHPGGAAVLPLHADGSVTLIRQLRPAINDFLMEIPAGRLSKGEDPAACATRELIEETGLRADKFTPLGILHPSPGVFDEVVHLYLATGLAEGEAEPEDYEDISSIRIPLAKALEMAADGSITDGKTIAALLRAQRHIG
ncbi:ADP-ribose pyrophosphatase [Citrifermentans bremense]|uniref:GDP-mannose pyrophosphatase n=1 Tax=Citrifermentans bremense TaxID=60035 RepID=A0A6S6MB47_9BACT|nr:NUDIX hydrolase [Citrifermentans bremense]BCG48761.1 ADP-ribose pyrophosphatase [Citrifermentans bremense]